MDTATTVSLIINGAAAFFTATMAGFTWSLARETRRLSKDWRDTSSEQVKAWFKTSSEQIGIRTWMTMEARFDSEEMAQARRKLATTLKAYSPAAHGKVSETVLNFFESLGTVYKEGHINTKLADESFGFYACRWWEAAKSYVDQERKIHKGDDSLFEHFEDLAKLMRLPEEVIDHEEMTLFLAAEAKLQ